MCYLFDFFNQKRIIYYFDVKLFFKTKTSARKWQKFLTFLFLGFKPNQVIIRMLMSGDDLITRPLSLFTRSQT